ADLFEDPEGVATRRPGTIAEPVPEAPPDMPMGHRLFLSWGRWPARVGVLSSWVCGRAKERQLPLLGIQARQRLDNGLHRFQVVFGLALGQGATLDPAR